MPVELTILEQIEQWLDQQVPDNLHDLPFKMLESVERISNDLLESLNLHGPPSLNIPFPPFLSSAPPPPPPPPVVTPTFFSRAETYVRAHPYICASGAIVAIGLGVHATIGHQLPYLGAFYVKDGQVVGRRHIRGKGLDGAVEDGMLREAVVLLAPSPAPALLLPLVTSLAKHNYIVVIAVPQLGDADALEKQLASVGLAGKARVLIYDPEDPSTYPPFSRSLHATLTLRFPAAKTASRAPGDPYTPLPLNTPSIKAFVSLYALDSSPSSHSVAGLPALPMLLSSTTEKPPQAPAALVTVYPSGSILTSPTSFAAQLLTSAHRLLSRNLAATHRALGHRIIDVSLGRVILPAPQAFSGTSTPISKRQQAQADAQRSLTAIRSFGLWTWFSNTWTSVIAGIGIGQGSADWKIVEKQLLKVIARRSSGRYSIGKDSYLPVVLSKLPLAILQPTLGVTNIPRVQPVPAVVAPQIPGARSAPSAPASSSGEDSIWPGASDAESLSDDGNSRLGGSWIVEDQTA